MDATTAAACAGETRAFCGREADLLALVATRGDADRVRERRQRVHDCLADHADELTADCVAALVDNAATQHSALPEPDDHAAKDEPAADETQEPQHGEQTSAEETAPLSLAPGHTPVVVKLSPAPYTATPLSVAEPTPWPQPLLHQPQYVQTSGDVETGIEVRIILVNHPGAVAAAPPATPTYVRIGGDAAQHADSDSAAKAGFAMSPWLWVLVLPFMCIGMYVSAVQTIAFVRRRRDVVYRVGAAQYMPIPTSLSATKSSANPPAPRH